MKKVWIILVFLFLVAFGVRLYFAFQTENFTLDSYYSQRQVESIHENGVPLFFDPLSYGGKVQLFAPLYYYILAGLSFIFPYMWVAKILPNLAGASIIFFAYLLAKLITKDEEAAVFTGFISGFIPIFFSSTLNSVSSFGVILPLLLLQTYAFLSKKTKLFVALSFILPLIHYSAIIFPLSLLVFLLISKIEQVKVERVHFEYTMFSLLVALWLLFIFYKKALLFHGAELFIQNVPLPVLQESFKSITLVGAIYQIGIIPFVYGVIASYQFLFRKQNYEGFLILSFVLCSFVLLWFGAVQVETAVLILSIFLTVMFSYYYSNLSAYFKKTRFSQLKHFKKFYLVSLSTTFIITSVVPSLLLSQGVVAESLSQGEMSALTWAKDHIPQDEVLLSSLEEGDVISAIAEKKTFIDEHFLLVSNVPARYESYRRIFSSPFKIETIKELNRNDISYLYVSKRNPFEIPEGKFSTDCFTPRFSNEDVTIYEVTCELQTR